MFYSSAICLISKLCWVRIETVMLEMFDRVSYVWSSTELRTRFCFIAAKSKAKNLSAYHAAHSQTGFLSILSLIMYTLYFLLLEVREPI